MCVCVCVCNLAIICITVFLELVSGVHLKRKMFTPQGLHIMLVLTIGNYFK